MNKDMSSLNVVECSLMPT